ncbi:divalent cation tolerance protein CutA [Nocardia sp. CDC186]|uniref:Divalent cation tolerance protein CutA n=1 Tax=Nocardia implantans TaxID=3108168 RepID=A0ABU6B0R2_9NOCA|nr:MULTISPECIES: divalent cation tolerance protein CutA [unclassified Nocardia]MEA3532065.1 divalent cation tolerance protein CutA [Nocardia sp. CDC192]MEB3513345.1 divalent cation tolerance protein CutA [Nocardia sp. CDC186]
MEDVAEAAVVLHTRRSLVPAIIERVNKDNPYDAPQVLAVPVVEGHPGYRQ